MSEKLTPMAKPDELAAVPINQPVLVDLGRINIDALKPDKEVTDDLEKQLVTMSNANEAYKEREATLQRERDEAMRTASEATNFANQAHARMGQSDSDMASSSLAAAQAESLAATQEYERAAEQADFRAMAASQKKMSRAEAKILNAESLIADIDEQRKEHRSQGQQRQQLTSTDVIRNIDAAPGLTPKEKTWLKEHPELMLDQARNAELGVAHVRAVREGHNRGTEDYFKYIDDFLGFGSKSEKDVDEDGVVSAAPVSRDSVGGKPVSGTRVQLTPAEREIAQSMNLTDIEYAQQKLKLHQDKKQNPDRYYTPSGR